MIYDAVFRGTTPGVLVHHLDFNYGASRFVLRTSTVISKNTSIVLKRSIREFTLAIFASESRARLE